MAASERRHSGEIRVCVEAGLPLSYLWRDATARERAVTMFGKLRVWDTEHNNGVLIYLLLAEHAIEIVADRGLNRHVCRSSGRRCSPACRARSRPAASRKGWRRRSTPSTRCWRSTFRSRRQVNPNELPDAPRVG